VGFLFPNVPAPLGADGFGCSEMCAGVEPARDDRPARELWSFAREIGENRLRHILRQVRIAVQLSQRC